MSMKLDQYNEYSKLFHLDFVPFDLVEIYHRKVNVENFLENKNKSELFVVLRNIIQ